MMLVCLLMSYEFPRRRTEERFVIDEPHEASLGNGDIRRRVACACSTWPSAARRVRMPGEGRGEPLAVGSQLRAASGRRRATCRARRAPHPHRRGGHRLRRAARGGTLVLGRHDLAHSYENTAATCVRRARVWGWWCACSAAQARVRWARATRAAAAARRAAPRARRAPGRRLPALARRARREWSASLERATARDTQRALELASRRPPLRRIAAA
jgi:hypothetical protein